MNYLSNIARSKQYCLSCRQSHSTLTLLEHNQSAELGVHGAKKRKTTRLYSAALMTRKLCVDELNGGGGANTGLLQLLFFAKTLSSTHAPLSYTVCRLLYLQQSLQRQQGNITSGE
jgi:hypothetical protein